MTCVNFFGVPLYVKLMLQFLDMGMSGVVKVFVFFASHVAKFGPSVNRDTSLRPLPLTLFLISFCTGLVLRTALDTFWTIFPPWYLLLGLCPLRPLAKSKPSGF